MKQFILSLLAFAAYVVAVVILCNAEIDVRNYDSILVAMHLLVGGAIIIAPAYKGKFLRSFSFFFLATVLVWMLPYGTVLGHLLFLLIGCYHTSFINDEEFYNGVWGENPKGWEKYLLPVCFTMMVVLFTL